jgi:DNA-binding CsgD family transcriptional regulator
MVSFRVELGAHGIAAAGKAAYVFKDAAAGAMPDDELTPKGREVQRLILEGKKDTEIARIMSRSVHTMRNHRARWMRQLAVRFATDGVDAAACCGVVACAASAGASR